MRDVAECIFATISKLYLKINLNCHSVFNILFFAVQYYSIAVHRGALCRFFGAFVKISHCKHSLKTKFCFKGCFIENLSFLFERYFYNLYKYFSSFKNYKKIDVYCVLKFIAFFINL